MNLNIHITWHHPPFLETPMAPDGRPPAPEAIGGLRVWGTPSVFGGETPWKSMKHQLFWGKLWEFLTWKNSILVFATFSKWFLTEIPCIPKDCGRFPQGIPGPPMPPGNQWTMLFTINSGAFRFQFSHPTLWMNQLWSAGLEWSAASRAVDKGRPMGKIGEERWILIIRIYATVLSV